jgi:hypothetical protein
MNVVLLRIGIDTAAGGIHGPLFAAPKGHNGKAQGNALGTDFAPAAPSPEGAT